MGAWSAGISGSDTAEDLKSEYTAAFWRYEPEEAVARLDAYVRAEMGGEEDAVTWCDYVYSLADFMWKKGILTDGVRDRALTMMDADFGIEEWAVDAALLRARRKALAGLREKLTSPLPPRKKIRPNVCLTPIFETGDLVALRLSTAGKPYAGNGALTDAEFAALDGKYVLMQKVGDHISWESAVVPEVRDHWCLFRLFYGIYDEIPRDADPSRLPDADPSERGDPSPYFTCESTLVHFRRRGFEVIGNYPLGTPAEHQGFSPLIALGANHSRYNAESDLIDAMKGEPECDFYSGDPADLLPLLRQEAGRFYSPALSHEENERRITQGAEALLEELRSVRTRGGAICVLRTGAIAGCVGVLGGRIGPFCPGWRIRKSQTELRLLRFAVDAAGSGAYMDIPDGETERMELCRAAGLTDRRRTVGRLWRMKKPCRSKQEK